MKNIKFLISAIIIALGFIIIGELHHLYLDNFMNGITFTTLYLQSNISEKDMKEDILKSAEDNNIIFFVLQSDVKSTFKKEFYIYESKEKIQKYLNTEFDIEEKEYKSIFSGSLKFHYENYKNISDQLLLENHFYYLVGENKNIHNFKMELIDKYAGNHPIYHTKSKESRNTVVAVWLIIYILLFILTIYDSMLQQKEIYIRVIFGENIYRLILKNIFLDSGIYIGIFFLSFSFLKQFTMNEFNKNISFLVFGIFIFINSLQYFRWMFLDITNVLKKGMFSTKVLCATYIAKSISIVFAILIIAANINGILESIEYASQKSFFEKNKDYFYTNLDYKEIIGENGLPVEDYGIVMQVSAKMKEIFYQKYFDKFSPIILVYFGEIEDYDVILANTNATDYLFEEIPELKDKVTQEGYYYIMPEEIKESIDIRNGIDLKMENYDTKDALNDRKVISYSGSKKILNIDELSPNGSKYCTNPIIVLNTIKPIYNSNKITEFVFKTTFEHDILYKIDQNEFNQFIKEYGLENHFHALTNAYEKYQYNWLVMKRICYMNFMFCLLILFLEFIIIKTIINLEFKINAVELSIKKVFGYSYIQRYKQIMFISTVGSLICIIIGVILGAYLDMNFVRSIAISGILIYILDFAAIRFAIEKNERANISNILKGGYV